MVEADSAKSAELEQINSSSGQQTVARLAELCLNTFQQGLNLSNSHHPRYLALIEDQLARFSIWTSGNGVFAKARASMDHRLREAPDVQLAVCSLLEALEDSLQSCLSSLELAGNLHEDSNAFDVQNEDFKLDVQTVAKEISLLYRLTNTIRRASRERQSIKAAKSYHIRDDEGNTIEPLLQDLYSHYILGKFPSIENNLRSRLAASMVLRRKMVLYRRSRYGINPIRADKNISQPKIDFPQARTQTTNTDEPSEELADGIEAVGTTAPQSSIQSQAQSATTLAVEEYKKASTPSVISVTKTVALANHEELVFPPIPNGRVKERYKKLKQLRWEESKERMIQQLRDQELRPGIDKAFKSTDGAIQRTVILTKLRSCLDFALEGSSLPCRQKGLGALFDSFLETDEPRIYEPEWLMSGLDKMLSREIETISSSLDRDWIECNEAIGELTCPYCLYAVPSLSVADDKKWKTHVTKDLDAYVCLFDECDKPDKLFSHSSDWLHHMREHTLRWSCNSKAHRPLTFLTEDEYLDHVRQDHPRSLTEPQLRALAQRNARTTVPMFNLCPICGTGEATDNLEAHIVGHLRFLALKSLPPHEEDGSGSSDSESGSAAASGPASRSTIKNDPERHISVVFEDHEDNSSWGFVGTEKMPLNVDRDYKGYLETSHSSALKMRAETADRRSHIALLSREEEEARRLLHNDPSRYEIMGTRFAQIPMKERRDFEWGFVSCRTDEPNEALQHDYIIRSLVNHSLKTQSTETGGPTVPGVVNVAKDFSDADRLENYQAKDTPIAERVSLAKKGYPVHVCDQCKPSKTFTRAGHLRRHQLSHNHPELVWSHHIENDNLPELRTSGLSDSQEETMAYGWEITYATEPFGESRHVDTFPPAPSKSPVSTSTFSTSSGETADQIHSGDAFLIQQLEKNRNAAIAPIPAISDWYTEMMVDGVENARKPEPFSKSRHVDTFPSAQPKSPDGTPPLGTSSGETAELIEESVDPTPLPRISPENAVTESTPLEPVSIPKSTPTTEPVPYADSMVEEPRVTSESNILIEVTNVTERVARALRGLGAVDTGALIQDLALFTHDQIMSLRREYKLLVKVGPERKGVNVAKHIRARLIDDPPNLMKACYAVALGKWESEAYWCNIYHHSTEIRRELLIESLMGRTNEEIRLIKDAFSDKKHDNSLQKCLNSELEENKFKKALFLVLEERQMEEFDSDGRPLPIDKERAAKDVEDLRRAIKSEKGGESRMIEILVQGSATYLQELLELYRNQYSSNLAREILQKCGNLVGEFLVHILNGVINRPVRDALLLYSAITTSRTADSRSQLLTSRLVRYHWDREHMGAVSAAYSSRYGTSLEEAVRESTSGVWGEFCVQLCTAHLKERI